MKNIMKKQKGFTLLELVVVVAVMGLIASLATEFVAQNSNQNRHLETKHRISEIRSAVTNYYRDCGRFPTSLSLLLETSATASECDDLGSNWAGPYIFNVDYEHCKDDDGNDLAGYPRLVYRDGWGTGYCEVQGDLTFNDFGWSYSDTGYDGSYPTLQSYGLDGVSDALPSHSSGYNYNEDYPLSTYPLVRLSSGDFELRSTTSGAVSVLSCHDTNASGAEASLADCFN
jgi:general secretion pathway protein G